MRIQESTASEILQGLPTRQFFSEFTCAGNVIIRINTIPSAPFTSSSLEPLPSQQLKEA